MPRVSRAQTEANREAIEAVSARLIREAGLGVSVADVMQAAGLTHGGFYGHFASKDALKVAACERAFCESLARWERRVAERPAETSATAAVVAGYLSQRSRDAPGNGCPVAALAGDVAREPRTAPVRVAYARGLAASVARLQAVDLADGGTGDADRALVRLAAMVGALLLARATAGTPVSLDILAAARAALAAPTGAVAVARRRRPRTVTGRRSAA